MDYQLRNRFIVICITTLIVSVLFSSCNKSPQNNSSKPSDQVEIIKIGYLPIAECFPLFVAIEQGYIKDVETVAFPGGAQALEALNAGSVDISFSNIVSAIFAVNNNIDLVSVWGKNIEDSAHVLHALVIKKNSTIKDPRDIYNKTIALNNKKNIDELMITNWLSAMDIPKKNVQLLEVPFPRMSTVLQSDNVDMIAVVEPYLTLSLQEGNRKIAQYFLEYNSSKCVEITSYFTKKDFILQKRVSIDRFVQGMDSALIYINNHPGDRYRFLKKYTKLDSSVINKISLPLFSRDLPSEEGVHYLVDLMQKNGWIKKEIKRKDLVRE